MIEASAASRYAILVPAATLARAADCVRQLREDPASAGALMREQLRGADMASMTPLELLGKLFDTKRPKIFAEMAVVGDGSDWTLTELGLLGDVSVAVPVTVYDNGHHTAPVAHATPFPGVLLFVPGALLRNGRGQTPADWQEVTRDGQLSDAGYYSLYQRRLLPVLRYINDHAATPRSALVTIPGLGCGQFAGPFRRQLGTKLQAVLERLLIEHGHAQPNLKAIHFDPYSECANARRDIHGIAYRVRPFKAPDSAGTSQLCRPVDYAEPHDDFSQCTLYSVVAWDHVSWPGNDFFAGARATDDGVKAAATSSMAQITGVEGTYDSARGLYLPPAPYRTWEQLAYERMRGAQLRLWDERAVWITASPP